MDHNGFRQGGNSSPRDSRSAQNSLGSRHPERGRGNSFHSKPYYLKPTLGPPWVTGPPPENQTLLRYGKSSVFGAVKQHEWFPKCAVPFCVALVLP